jgi:hypothetical protein
MLVCNVSQSRRRAAIAADIMEAVLAADSPGTGNVVFATLVDDPASVGDHVDAFLGQIMREAASAAATVNAGLAYGVTIAESVSASTAVGATLTYAATIAEAATGADAPDATKISPTSLVITGTPVTTGTEYEHGVGSVYTGFTVAASAGSPPYTYSIASGTLPSGITLNSSTGAVSGTPAFQSAGTYSGIVIRATDNVAATADLAPFTLTIAFKDPYYSNTKLLFDYDAPDGNQVFDDMSFSNHTTLTTVAGVGGATQHDTGVTPLYGTSSILFSTTGDVLKYGPNADWRLLGNFTIDFTARSTTVTGNQDWIGVWNAAPNLAWLFRQTGNQASLFISTTGSDFPTAVQSAAAAVVANTWARWRVDFDGTKYRLYKDGTMIASSTTVRSPFNGNSNLAIGTDGLQAGSFFNGNCRGIRLTVGTARTASDSGYVISNRAFPTS